MNGFSLNKSYFIAYGYIPNNNLLFHVPTQIFNVKYTKKKDTRSAYEIILYNMFNAFINVLLFYCGFRFVEQNCIYIIFFILLWFS